MHEPTVDQLYVERWPKAHLASPTSRRALAFAHVFLVLVSAAGVFAFTRVFDSNRFVFAVGTTAAVAHAASAFARHRRWRGWVAVPLCLLAVALTAAVASVRPSFGADISDAWAVVNDTRSPVPPTRALVLLASLVVGVAVVVADALAFRRRALFGALLPGVFVFGLTAMYGDDRHRFVSVLFVTVASVGFALAHRTAFFDRGGGWVVDRAPSHHRYVMSGLAVAGCAVLVALAIGPSLPGARNEALVDWRDIGNSWGRQNDGVSLAPLVSVRAQLVEQSDKQVFTVEATRADYWRLTALDTFDGVTWSASAPTDTPVTLPSAPTTDALRQVVSIDAMRGNVVPAALAAIAVDTNDGVVTYDASTATLRTDDGLGKGDTFTVWSRATDTTSPSSAARSLPRGLRRELSPLVSQIVRNAGATSPIDRARALERYFLANFTYDLDVAAGSSITDIESFLAARRGYCEQFAATFAAMARVLDIPSRVAVGYRVGTLASANQFSVTGRDAHAWPELYLSGTWVRFDPTPATPDADPASETPAAAADVPGSTAPAADAATIEPVPEADPALQPQTDAAPVDTTPVARSSRFPTALVVGSSLFVLALAALPILIDAVRRRRRHHRARHDPRALILWRWHDSLRWFRIAGANVRHNETPTEIASRAGPVINEAAPELTALARLVTAACYAPDDPTPADVETADAESAAIRRDAKHHLGRWWWLRAYVDQVRGIAAHSGSAAPSRTAV